MSQGPAPRPASQIRDKTRAVSIAVEIPGVRSPTCNQKRVRVCLQYQLKKNSRMSLEGIEKFHQQRQSLIRHRPWGSYGSVNDPEAMEHGSSADIHLVLRSNSSESAKPEKDRNVKAYYHLVICHIAMENHQLIYNG